ncbi:MAG: hypothetical protein MUF23_17055 [Pirellula sp.]|jgi:hypothetical protein|nr:hypothetical protein [Pirellula sp.]
MAIIRNYWIFAIVGLVAVLFVDGVLFAAATSPPESVAATNDRPVGLELRVSESRVPPGATFELNIRMNIRKEYEIHPLDAPPPSIPTQIDCRLPSCMEFEGEWSLPVEVPSLRPDGHSGYQGEVNFRRTIRVTSNAPQGEQRLESNIRFQACNEKLCLRPVSVPLSIAITVADAKTTVEPNPESAEEIVKTLLATYRDLKSYQDTGVVRTVFHGEDNEIRASERPFKIAWVSPDQFRFEYSDRSILGRENRYVIWMNGNSVQSHWTLKAGPKTEQGIARALAGAVGVSGGSASLVPSLLMPDTVPWGPISRLEELQRLEDQDLGTHGCRRVTGKLEESTYTLWIDRDSMILRRVDIQMPLKDFRAETEILIEPKINEPVAEEHLEFSIE